MPKNLSDINWDALLFMLKGEPGTRKSTQALSFPTPQYWFSVDKKMHALAVPAKEWGINRGDIEYDDFSTYDEILSKLRTLTVTCPYKTVIIDSVTSTGDVINNQTISRRKKSTGSKTAVGGIEVGEWDDYKAEARAFCEIMDKINDIRNHHGINVILIAHVIGERAKDTIDTLAQSRIIITGGKTISGKISAYMVEVYNFSIKPAMDADEEGIYGLTTIHTGVDFARTSLGLERRINFRNKPLYATYIKPAIDKQKERK